MIRGSSQRSATAFPHTTQIFAIGSDLALRVRKTLAAPADHLIGHRLAIGADPDVSVIAIGKSRFEPSDTVLATRLDRPARSTRDLLHELHGSPVDPSPREDHCAGALALGAWVAL
jgi:hypothetical protein